MPLFNFISRLVANGQDAFKIILVQKFVRTAALCIILNEDDVAFVWRAADVEDMFLLAGLVVPRYLKRAVLMPLNQKNFYAFAGKCLHRFIMFISHFIS